MARPLRIEYPGAIYHVLSRGDRREAIFRNDADRKLFLDLLAQTCRRTGWQIDAYCLMDNHFHLVVETPRSSSLVENLNSRLRNYFTLRRHLGGSYLDLLQFFLNHRCFMRSRRAERIGKSPRQLMTGQSHPHWLTLLGLGPLLPQQA